MPSAFIPPMKLQTAETPFDDEAYLFEPKWDGIRIQLHMEQGRTEAYSPSGRLVTGQFPELELAARQVDSDRVVLDCEGVCLREGRPVFDDFAYRMRLQRADRIERSRHTHPAAFIALDILEYGGTSLLRQPLSLRKERLAQLVEPSELLLPTMSVRGRGTLLYARTEEQRLEGMVAKRLDGPYLPGRLSADWTKIKHWQSIDVMILGYRLEPVFALIGGLHFRTVRSKPVGIIEQGISTGDRAAFLEAAPPLHTRREGTVQWVEPVWCCRIRYRDRDDMHRLSPCIFERFQPEVRPEDCVWHYGLQR